MTALDFLDPYFLEFYRQKNYFSFFSEKFIKYCKKWNFMTPKIQVNKSGEKWTQKFQPGFLSLA